MKKVYINGYFTSEHINGVPRYATEIVKKLDQYFQPGEAELVVPKNANNIPKLNNISICTWRDRGKKREINNVLWGEISYKKYISGKNGLNVNLTNRAERIKESITTIHDLITLKNYRYGFELSAINRFKMYIYSIIDKQWFCHRLRIKKKYSLDIVTVSETSKMELSEKLGIPDDKITVIGNGWEHILSIDSKDEKKDERIKKGNYFFSIGNLKPHKNFQWILTEAKIMPDELFVVAGKIPSNIVNSIKRSIPNVILLGYISDEYMKYLMENAKGLLYPSFIEGFGIPPLEALALDTPVLVSDIPIMHEIFENTVGYFDPYKNYNNLNELFNNSNKDDIEEILQKHSWDAEAKKWFQLIKKSI